METFTDDTVVALVSFLSPHDMLSLALTCKRFGNKQHGTDKKRSADREESSREVRQRTESKSLIEVAAHTVLHTKWSEDEENALPRRGDESWIGLYQEFLKLFRLPLQFDKLVGEYVEYVGSDSKDKTSVCSIARESQVYEHHDTAICSNIMRAGKHCVSFDVNGGDRGISCGIMRPTTNDITSCLTECSPVWRDLSMFSLKEYNILHSDNVDCCLLYTYTGKRLVRKRWKKWWLLTSLLYPRVRIGKGRKKFERPHSK